MIDRVADEVIRGYVKEACGILRFDVSNVRIIYVPQIQPDAGISHHSTITPDGCLVFDESWVNQEIRNETPTRTRCEVYCKVRMLYQQAKRPNGFDKYSNEAIDDALAFNCALQAIKGLTLPMPSITPQVIFLLDKTQRILKEEFGMNTEYCLMPKEFVKSDNVWKLRLTQNDEKKYADRYYTKPPKSTVRVIDKSEKGTEENPFDNVNEASDYIRKLEDDAFANDALLRDIASQQYFYDLEFRQFRVPWACSYVSFYRDDSIPSDGFIVNQNQIHPDGKFHFTLKPNLYGKKFLYRGQSQDYPKPCTPNLYRDENKTYFLDDLIWSQEMEVLLMTHPLVKLLEEGVVIMHDHFSILMNLVGLAQHYYHKTHFLDLTSDLEGAKFFATTNYDKETDEYKPVHSTEKLGMIYCYELQMPGAFAQQEGYALSVIGKQVFMRSGAQHGFLLEMDKGVDFKKIPQVRKFYFRHDPTISDEIFKQSNNGKKYFPMDILEEVWKDKYKQRLENRIVSADAVRLNVSRNPGETFESICQKLKNRNIIVDDIHPSFAPELLDQYYKSIKEGWWEEFCSDIYFHGGDAALYKDCLMRISKRDEYRWAFER